MKKKKGIDTHSSSAILGLDKASGKNADFIKFLATASPSEKREVANKIRQLDLLDNDPNGEFMQSLFTENGDDLVMNPLIVKFGMEELSDSFYQSGNTTAWLDNALIFVGEIPFEMLSRGDDFTGVSLEKLIEDYYNENGLGPVPENFKVHLKEFLKLYQDDKNWSDITEDELVYYSYFLSTGQRQQKFMSGMNGKKLYDYVERFLSVHKLYRDNPTYFPVDNKSYTRFYETIFLDSMYYAALFKYLVVENDLKKAADILKLYNEDLNVFIGNKPVYSKALTTAVNHLSELITLICDEDSNGKVVNMIGTMELFLNFALELKPKKADRIALLHYCNFVLLIYNVIMENSYEMLEALGDQYNPLTYKPGMFEHKDISVSKGFKLEVEDMHQIIVKIKAALLECIELVQKTNEEYGDEKGSGSVVYVELLKALTMYELSIEKNTSEVLKLWEDAVDSLQRLLNESPSPSDLLRASCLYAKLFLVNLYFDPTIFVTGSTDIGKLPSYDLNKNALKKAGVLLKDSLSGIRYMESLVARKDSVTAFELIIWYYQLMVIYCNRVDNSQGAVKAKVNMDKYQRMGMRRGIENLGNSSNFIWDLY